MSLVDETFEIGLDEVEGAKRIMFGGYGLTARGAIHISVMQTHEIPEILSFDTGFDAFPGIRRLA